MHTFWTSLSLALPSSFPTTSPSYIVSAPTASAAPCKFQITASGGVSGVAGQLSDGQIRINGTYAKTDFSIDGGRIMDPKRRGCILTPEPVTQFQCDDGAAPISGFSIDSAGSIHYNQSSKFYACPATDTEYNLYTNPNFGQTKCVLVTLTANACFSGGETCAAATQIITKTTTVYSTITFPLSGSAGTSSGSTQGNPSMSDSLSLSSHGSDSTFVTSITSGAATQSGTTVGGSGSTSGGSGGSGGGPVGSGTAIQSGTTVGGSGSPSGSSGSSGGGPVGSGSGSGSETSNGGTGGSGQPSSTGGKPPVGIPTTFPEVVTISGSTFTVNPTSPIVIGSETLSLPQVSSPTTITTDGITITLFPGSTGTVLPTTTRSQVITIPRSVSTGPDGSVVTFPGTTETLSDPFTTTITVPRTTFTGPGGSLTTFSGTTTTATGDSHHLIPCINPPIPLCIPCVFPPLNRCFPSKMGGGGPGDTGKPTSSCSTTKARSCRVTTSCPTQSPEQTTTVSCRTSTSCRTLTGCSVTPTTTSTCIGPRQTGANGALIRRDSSCSPPLKFYAIYPRDGTNPADVSAIDNFLANLEVNTIEGYYRSISVVLGVNFWYAPLTELQFDAVKGLPQVLDAYISKHPGEIIAQKARREVSNSQDSVSETTDSAEFTSKLMDMKVESNSTDDASRLMKRTLTVQTNAPLEMAFISWTRNQDFNLNGNADKYNYDDSAGRNQIVYSLDYGAVLNNPEFAHLATRARFLFAEPHKVSTPTDQPMIPDTPRGGHGSCMLSKIAGRTYGAAKNVMPVMTTFDYSRYTNEDFLDGLSKIYDDVIARGRPGNSIVSISVHWVLDRDQSRFLSKTVSRSFIDRVRFIIEQLIIRGVFVVTGAGNGGGRVNGYPAKFGDPSTMSYIPELLIVGAVDVNGMISPSSKRADYVSVYAPGKSLRSNDPTGTGFGQGALSCADSEGGIASPKDGTSIATATVAGLAAYFRGLGRFTTQGAGQSWREVVADLKAEIENLAWDRLARLVGNQNPEPAKSLWNGYTPPPCNQGSGGGGGGGGEGEGHAKRQAGGSTCPGNPGTTITTNTGTTTSPTTTTTTEMPTTTAQAPPPPSHALSIIFITTVEISGGGAATQNAWQVFTTTPGTAVDVCIAPKPIFTQPLDPSKSPNIRDFLSGTFSFPIDGVGTCQYTGTSSGPGTFNCPGFLSPLQCVADEDTQQTCSAQGGQSTIIPSYARQVLCTW